MHAATRDNYRVVDVCPLNARNAATAPSSQREGSHVSRWSRGTTRSGVKRHRTTCIFFFYLYTYSYIIHAWPVLSIHVLQGVTRRAFEHSSNPSAIFPALKIEISPALIKFVDFWFYLYMIHKSKDYTF